METEPLAKACELAFVVARQGVEANPPIEPPAAMRSFLYVPQLPRRAITVAQRVIDEDPAFRARVAAQATESNVGEAGYRWLSRPNGWDSEHVAQGTPAETPLPDLPAKAGELVPPPQPSQPAVPPPAPPVRLVATPSGVVPPPPPPPPVRQALRDTEQPQTGPEETAEASGDADAKVSIEEELASLRGLVARLAEERHDTDAVAAPDEKSPPPAQTLAPAPSQEAVEQQRAADEQRAAQEQALAASAEELEQARQDRDRAQTERENLLTHQGELEIELADVRASAEQANQEAARARTDLEQTRADLAEARTEADAARSRVAELEAGAEEFRSQIDSAVADRDSAWNESAVLRVERDQLEDRVRVAEQARVDLESQLDEMSSNWQDLKVEHQNVAGERDVARRSLEELSAATQSAAAERRALFNELATQLGQVESERDHLVSQIERMREQLLGTRSALDSANQTVRGELDSAEAAASSSVEAIGRLDSSLGGAHERLANLDLALDSGAVTSPDGSDAAATTDPSPEIETPVIPTPPSPPRQASSPAGPGVVSGEVEIDSFLPEGVEVESSETASSDATLFGNPRDVHDRGLFSDRVVEERTSADDDQALANVMASYGFGVDDDVAEEPFVAGDPDTTGLEEDSFTFDASDTSSFIDPDHVAAQSESEAMAADDSHARRVATTPDMVMLVDGDAAATMGWRDSSVLDRRRYLLEKLDQVTGEYGPALDVVFDASVGGEDALPAPTKVRRRLIEVGTTAEEKLSELVDSYPSHFPIAVVSDQAGLRDQLRLRSVESLEVVELLDLIIGLPEPD